MLQTPKQKLIKIANSNNVAVNEVKLEEAYRFKSEELKFLEKNLYVPTQKYEQEVNNIKLFLARFYIKSSLNKIYFLIFSG